MTIRNLLITGESLFLDRHAGLFQALAQEFEQVRLLARNSEWYEAKLPRTVLKGLLTLRTGSRNKANALFQKNRLSFVMKSLQAERSIQKLKPQPDLVFQVFGTYSPFWTDFSVPYVMYLDYTAALAEQNWEEWVIFLNQRSRTSWYECEQLAYERASHLFCMSDLVKSSLIYDYHIPPHKITVVGSSGDFQALYSGEKTFGSKQILFNGSDFGRKGGDLLLEAFPQVKAAIPEATLVIVGKSLQPTELINQSGIINPGHVASRQEMQRLFLTSDVVVAPAYCDPFPTFLLEAMNYGVPCIVSNRDGMPEIVDHRINGIVLDRLTADQLAEAIIDLLNQPEKLNAFSQDARQKIQAQFNWAVIAREIRNIIAHLPPMEDPSSNGRSALLETQS